MRSGGLPVHLGLADVSVFHSSVEDIHEFFTVEGSFFCEILDKDSFFGILSDVKFFLFSGFEQVHDLFIVQFEIGASD